MWWTKSKEDKTIENLDLRKPAVKVAMPVVQTPMPEPIVEKKVSAVEKYNNAIEELKLKFLLALSDQSNDWVSGNTGQNQAPTQIFFRDIFMMEKNNSGLYVQYSFYCKGLLFHQTHQRMNQHYDEERDNRCDRDKLVQGYERIAKRLEEERVEAEYNRKVDELYEILEQI